MMSTWNLGRLAYFGLVCNFGWSQLAANFDPGLWVIQKLDCFENTLKNPGFLWRISCSISHLATIICPKKIFFPILAHCETHNMNLWSDLKNVCERIFKVAQLITIRLDNYPFSPGVEHDADC